MAGKAWEIIGAPFDLGSSDRGSGEAPAAIRAAGVSRRLEYFRSMGAEVVDGGDVSPSQPTGSDTRPRGLDEMREYAPRLMARLDEAFRNDRVPLVLGGDHSISIPTVSAAADFLRTSVGEEAALGLVWVDAHPDLETPGDDGTNDLHAMSTAHLLGVSELRSLQGCAPKLRPDNVIYIGLRDVVPEERRTIEDLGIKAYTASDVEEFGIVKICQEVFETMKKRTDAFVLSFDIDAIDPSVAPAVDYPEPGGLTAREGMVILEFAWRADNLMLLELVEVNPSKDRGDTTSRLATRLIQRALCGPVV